MRLISEELSFWRDLLSMLEAQYGSNCEIVLHDLTKDYNHTIVDIRNGPHHRPQESATAETIWGWRS